MMKPTILVSAILLLALAPAFARDVDVLPELVDVRAQRPAEPVPTVVPADTTFLLGGPGALSGKFETADGQPDWQGWTSVDLTQDDTVHWSASTFNAANLDTITDNHAWWCGDLFPPCAPNDPPEGVGNNWNQLLAWSGSVADTTLGCTIRVRADLNLDLEPSYDFLLLQVDTATQPPVFFADFTGLLVGYQLDETHALTPADYLPGGEVHLRWLVATDGAFSDEDCLWPTAAGGCQIDNITVTFDQGDGEVLIGQVETAEPGSDLQWTPVPLRGVGDYAKVWQQLGDLDPDADNLTPQVAFIDDGEVEPDSDGSPCISWCYGPDGFIVTPGRGLGEVYSGIDNEIRSPIIALPPGGIGGALLAYDVYVHAPLEWGAPYIFPTWRLRSTDDADGLVGWSEWQSHEIGLWGDPTYVRPFLNVTDLLVPDAAYVQIALGVRNWTLNSRVDGTPAPYFDNVAFMVHDSVEPNVLLVRADGAGEYATIQEAIYAAAPGDTILLADGVYSGDGNRGLSFLGKSIVISSQNGDPATCIIDSEGSESDRQRAFYLNQGGGPGAVLSGVTVRGGREQRGSGIYVRECGLTIERCVFTDNIATGGTFMNGGALYSDKATVVVVDCIFEGNEANLGAAIALADSSSLEISGSLFVANRAAARGAGIYAGGRSTATVTGCTFVANRDQLSLGIITVEEAAHATVGNSIVAFSQIGRAVYCSSGGMVDLHCSNLFDNHNGNWDGCIADQLGTEGNISADPLFCGDLNPDDPYTLDAGSPCAPADQPTCGLIGARPVACDVIAAAPEEAPSSLLTRLHHAQPNPFNPRTCIRFDLASSGPVDLVVFDLRGRLVRTLVAESLPAGAHERWWDGRSDQGRAAASGTYLVRMVADGRIACRRIALLK